MPPAGSDAIMVATWETDPDIGRLQRPMPIPAEIFHAHFIGRLPASHLSLRTAKHVPDFVMKIAGEVPLPDNEVPLVGVLFRDNSVKALTMSGAKLRWDFGDGQTSDLPNADHVYLQPGLYAVKLSVRRAGKSLEITNRIDVERPRVNPAAQEKQYSLGDYLPIIETYEPKTLDAPSLCQMVRVFEAKADALANRAEDASQRTKAVEEDPNRRHDRLARPSSAGKGRPTQPRAAGPQAGPSTESDRYLAKAVAAGRAAFEEGSAAKGEEDLLKLAQLVGPMAREQLGDSEAAFQIWRGAAGRIAAGGGQGGLRDGGRRRRGERSLEGRRRQALAGGGRQAAGRQQDRPHRRANSPGCGATITPPRATASRPTSPTPRPSELWRPPGRSAKTSARRGAHARSTEEFIKEKQFGRAAAEIQAWQAEFPQEKVDGYLTLLWARYWAGRGKFAQAIALGRAVADRQSRLALHRSIAAIGRRQRDAARPERPRRWPRCTRW